MATATSDQRAKLAHERELAAMVARQELDMANAFRRHVERLAKVAAAAVVGVVLTLTVGFVLMANVLAGAQTSPVLEVQTAAATSGATDMVAHVLPLPDMAEDEYVDFNGNVVHVDEVCD